MSKVVRQIGFDEGAFAAREKEDVVVGGEIIRHRLSSRVIHWSVGVTFFLCLLTGLPVWTPVFGWMAALVGGLSVCRVVHPSFGRSPSPLASLAMAVQWWDEMKMTKEERGWVGPKLLEYLRDAANHDRIGKYNGGQKVYFYTSKLSALGLPRLGDRPLVPDFVSPLWCARPPSSSTTSRSSSSRSRSSSTSTSRRWPSPGRSTR